MLTTSLLALLQGYDAASKQYSIVLQSSQEVVQHTLEGVLWRQLKADKESLVGHRIEVWWPGDKAWYGGTVMVSVGCGAS